MYYKLIFSRILNTPNSLNKYPTVSITSIQATTDHTPTNRWLYLLPLLANIIEIDCGYFRILFKLLSAGNIADSKAVSEFM